MSDGVYHPAIHEAQTRGREIRRHRRSVRAIRIKQHRRFAVELRAFLHDDRNRHLYAVTRRRPDAGRLIIILIVATRNFLHLDRLAATAAEIILKRRVRRDHRRIVVANDRRIVLRIVRKPHRIDIFRRRDTSGSTAGFHVHHL